MQGLHLGFLGQMVFRSPQDCQSRPSRKLTEAECKLEDASRALKQAQSRIEAAEDRLPWRTCKSPLKRFTTQRKAFADLLMSFWNSYAFETRFEGLRRDRRRAGSLVRATDEKGFVMY
jgi:hypothetical protein